MFMSHLHIIRSDDIMLGKCRTTAYIGKRIHTYIHTYKHTNIHTYIHTYIHTSIHSYVNASCSHDTTLIFSINLYKKKYSLTLDLYWPSCL